MVDSSTKILSLVLFLVLISQGYGKCSLKNLYIRQTISGRLVKGEKEWNAQIINMCECPQSQIVLNCTGFHTTEPLNPPDLSWPFGPDFCYVRHGDPITSGTVGMVAFTYAYSDTPFPFTPVYSVPFC